MENAAKYSPAGTEIRINVSDDGSKVTFSVRDHGVGIAKEEQEKIFDKFYRVQVPGLPRTPGTGLGLTICKGIVEQHGGRIWVESTPGEGSCFFFTIPTVPDRASGGGR